jgi:hypothetical protein
MLDLKKKNWDRIRKYHVGSKQPTQLIVELNSSLRHIVVTIIII